MSTLHTGTYRALEEAFLKDLLARKQADPLANLLVLSPSATLLNHLQRLLANTSPSPGLRPPSPSIGRGEGYAPPLPMEGEGVGGEGFLNIHFLTFYALAERVLAEGPALEDRFVTEPALFREIVHDFLEGRGAAPFHSRKELIRPGVPIPKGLSGALAATLKDLQDSGAKVVDCANAAREGHLGDNADGAVPILELNVLMYKELHDRGLRVGADFIHRAADAIPKSGWIKGQTSIYLYGFYDLTGVQLDLINGLSGHPNTTVYFPYEEGNPAYGYAEILLKDPALTSKVSTRGHRDTGTRGNTEPEPSPRLRVTASSRQSVEAWSCSGTHDEIWLAAKKILELADSGVPFHHMSLQARTLDPYLNTIREVFESHRIPHALHAEEPVGAYPLIKRARQVLRENPASASGAWSSHVAWAKNLLASEIKLPKGADSTEYALGEGLQAAIAALSQLDILGRPVSRERFLDVLEEKLEGLRLPLTTDNAAGVQVMDVMTARGLSFEAVFLVGLNEKLFPRLIREDPFLSDAARSALASALGCRIGRKMDGYQEEKLLFHLAIRSSGHHLHLSCQRSDEEGKALVISLYLHDFLHKNNLELKPLRRAWMEKIRQVPPGTLRPKEISLVFHRENRDADALYQALGWDRELIARLLKSQSEIEAFGALGAHDGLIGKDHPLAKAILAGGLSPGTLKDLAECPFKIYGRKVLELDPDEKDVEDGEVAHTARGKIIHEILEQFYRGLPNTSPSPLMGEGMDGGAAEWESRLTQVSSAVFRRFEKDHPDLYPIAWQAEQNKILAVLKRFIPLDLAEMNESGFKPAYFELDLATVPGPTEQRSAALCQAPLHGRVDRLDIREGKHPAFRVVDYKAGTGGIGKKDKVETAILKGKNFQLPVYLLLARAWLTSQGHPAAKDGVATFYRLGEDDCLKIGPGFWDEHGERFYKNLSFLVKNIESGSFYIRPSDPRSYCSWCSFTALCRKEHKPTQIRADNSPLRKKHEEAFTPPKKGI
ncbi:MAG: hypothetical protein A2992_03025 [Elusimicrobia bacterium RIFCSPLOWO2_01_FULL_59_12]|nr:MAG: hypothetical protein A2992_03025 [Elusimicrobia bacterium RIFCSPLOWO2_01_FULL_59_12]